MSFSLPILITQYVTQCRTFNGSTKDVLHKYICSRSQDGSVGTHACHTSLTIGNLIPWNLHCRREPIPQCCPLTSTYVPGRMCAHILTCNKTHRWGFVSSCPYPYTISHTRFRILNRTLNLSFVFSSPSTWWGMYIVQTAWKFWCPSTGEAAWGFWHKTFPHLTANTQQLNI